MFQYHPPHLFVCARVYFTHTHNSAVIKKKKKKILSQRHTVDNFWASVQRKNILFSLFNGLDLKCNVSCSVNRSFFLILCVIAGQGALGYFSYFIQSKKLSLQACSHCCAVSLVQSARYYMLNLKTNISPFKTTKIKTNPKPLELPFQTQQWPSTFQFVSLFEATAKIAIEIKLNYCSASWKALCINRNTNFHCLATNLSIKEICSVYSMLCTMLLVYPFPQS